MLNALGAAEAGFCQAVTRQIGKTLEQFELQNTIANHSSPREMVAQVVGQQPKNETEAMLAVQMTAVHEGLVRTAGSLAARAPLKAWTF